MVRKYWLIMYKFDCQFRYNNNSPTACSYQSCRLGHIVNTSYLFCNNSCPQHIYLDNQEDPIFLKKCFHRRYDKNFISEVIQKYKIKTTIIVPDIWNIINETLRSFIQNQDWFVDIGLTGSIIVQGVSNHKDIDVVIYTKDIKKYIEWKTNNSFPSYINGTKIDYYIYTDPMVQFFTSLWPNSQTIILNSQFAENITVPLNYKILYNNFNFSLYQ